MTIKLEQFSGIAPKVSPHLLKGNMATVATNLRTDSGDIVALKGLTQVSTTSITHKSIYYYEKQKDTFTWLGWAAQGVNAIRSPVPNDRYRRLYVTGNGEPKYLYYDTFLPTPAVSSEYLLGIPQPRVAPVATTSGATSEALISEKTFTPGALTILGNAEQVSGVSSTAGSFVIGRFYTITSLGTTTTQANWNTIAGTTGKTYVATEPTGTQKNTFVCKTVGTGNGTATSLAGLARTTTGVNWTVQGYSAQSFKDNCVLRFSIANVGLAGVTVGLSTNPSATVDHKFDWSVYGQPTGLYQVLFKGGAIAHGASFTYVSTDVFEIEYVGTTITVRKNGTSVYATNDPKTKTTNKAVIGGQTFYMDSSFLGLAPGPGVSGTFSLVNAIEFGQYTIPAVTATIASGNFIVGQSYKIHTTGSTNFVAIGAVDNYPGTTFIATDVGSGTGLATTDNIFKSEAVTLTCTGNGKVSGTSVVRTAVKGVAWDTQATSSQSIVGACITRFQFGSIAPAAAGLNTPPLAAVGYAEIDYALLTSYLNNVPLVGVYENGTLVVNCGSWSLNDVFQIEVTAEGKVVYSKNGSGNPMYTSVSNVSLKKAFYFDSSLNGLGASITGIQLGVNLTNSDVLDKVNEDPVEKERAYVYTYVNQLGEEGPPSPATRVTVNDLQSVNLSFPSSVTDDATPKLDAAIGGDAVPASRPYNLVGGKRRIYRTAAGTTGSEYLFVADVPISKTTFSDSLLDLALGESLPSLNWFPPPLDMQGATSTPNGFIAGYSGNSLCVSEVMLPHAFNPLNQLGFPGTVTGIAQTGDSLVVFTDDAPYLVTGSTPSSLSAIRIDYQQTCANKASIVNMGGHTLFASPDGLCSVTANDMEIVTQDHLTRDQWQAYSPETMRGFLYEGVYIGFSDTKQFMFDNRSEPAILTDLSGFTVLSGFNDLSTDKLYVLDGAGHISTWETGTNKDYTWKSKLTRSPNAICPAALRIFATGTVIFRLYADGVLVFTAGVPNSDVVRLPSGYRAKEFQIEVSGNQTVQSVAIANSVSELQ